MRCIAILPIFYCKNPWLELGERVGRSSIASRHRSALSSKFLFLSTVASEGKDFEFLINRKRKNDNNSYLLTFAEDEK
jgi:hypothetical protein